MSQLELFFPGRLRGVAAGIGVFAGLVGATACFGHHSPKLSILSSGSALQIQGECPPEAESCTPINPTDVTDYQSEQYEGYRKSGFITLRPEMRLRVANPITPEGNSATGTSGQQPPAAGDSLGHQITFYNLEATRPGGPLRLSFDHANVKAASAGVQLQPVDRLAQVPKQAYYRLYHRFRRQFPGYGSVLLIASSLGSLNEASGALEEDPAKFCSAPLEATSCVAFPGADALTAEIEVYVNGKPVYVPLSGTLEDAIKLADGPQAAPDLNRISLKRRWNSRYRDVHFQSRPESLLQLPLIGGDRIRF